MLDARDRDHTPDDRSGAELKNRPPPARRGVFADVIVDGRPEDLENALDITLHRFREFMALQGAFGRRALIEQAKGILMARNGINADQADQLLKQQSQATGRKLVDIAESVTQSHLLIPAMAPVDA